MQIEVHEEQVYFPDPGDLVQIDPQSPLSPTEFANGLIDAKGPGAIDQIDALIDAIADPAEKAKAKFAWNRATQFERTHPLVVSLSAGLGMTAEEVDTLWQGALDAR